MKKLRIRILDYIVDITKPLIECKNDLMLYSYWLSKMTIFLKMCFEKNAYKDNTHIFHYKLSNIMNTVSNTIFFFFHLYSQQH